jgi:hypothetical protein
MLHLVYYYNKNITIPVNTVSGTYKLRWGQQVLLLMLVVEQGLQSVHLKSKALPSAAGAVQQVCQGQSSSYSVPVVTDATSYTLDGTAGATITGTTNKTITFAANATAGNNTVRE